MCKVFIANCTTTNLFLRMNQQILVQINTFIKNFFTSCTTMMFSLEWISIFMSLQIPILIKLFFAGCIFVQLKVFPGNVSIYVVASNFHFGYNFFSQVEWQYLRSFLGLYQHMFLQISHFDCVVHNYAMSFKLPFPLKLFLEVVQL